MSKKKIGHHWLSEAYLRNFCNSKNRVCVLTPQNRIFETSPHNICKENHYNTVNGSLIIEDSLSVIEGEVFKIINGKIKNRTGVSGVNGNKKTVNVSWHQHKIWENLNKISRR